MLIKVSRGSIEGMCWKIYYIIILETIIIVYPLTCSCLCPVEGADSFLVENEKMLHEAVDINFSKMDEDYGSGTLYITTWWGYYITTDVLGYLRVSTIILSALTPHSLINVLAKYCGLVPSTRIVVTPLTTEICCYTLFVQIQQYLHRHMCISS